MFDLKKQERFVLIVLLASLLMGLSVIAYKKLHTTPGMRIGHFSPGYEFTVSRRKVDINMASPEELGSLKGIGKVMAGRIIEYRDSHGVFSSTEDIKNVKGVGQALFNKIKDDITVGG
ncbi:MAG: ComEA family DNA-binding protein [Candidatus Omnitrophica bacterium]|nr:ComEA family DNA-binding protein [Candidatus Omnitrophota bacterium]